MQCEVQAKNLLTKEVVVAKNARELVKLTGTKSIINVTRYIQGGYLLDGKWTLDYTGFVYVHGREEKIPRGVYEVERALKKYYEYTVEDFKHLKEEAQLSVEDQLINVGLKLENMQEFYKHYGIAGLIM